MIVFQKDNQLHLKYIHLAGFRYLEGYSCAQTIIIRVDSRLLFIVFCAYALKESANTYIVMFMSNFSHRTTRPLCEQPVMI
jgi:hypothetical protein